MPCTTTKRDPRTPELVAQTSASILLLLVEESLICVCVDMRWTKYSMQWTSMASRKRKQHNKHRASSTINQRRQLSTQGAISLS
eukprot:1479891-Amphidinium_carterae.1